MVPGRRWYEAPATPQDAPAPGRPGAITPAQASAAPSPSLPALVTHSGPCVPFTFTGTQKGRNFLLHFLPQLSAPK